MIYYADFSHTSENGFKNWRQSHMIPSFFDRTSRSCRYSVCCQAQDDGIPAVLHKIIFMIIELFSKFVILLFITLWSHSKRDLFVVSLSVIYSRCMCSCACGEHLCMCVDGEESVWRSMQAAVLSALQTPLCCWRISAPTGLAQGDQRLMRQPSHKRTRQTHEYWYESGGRWRQGVSTRSTAAR